MADTTESGDARAGLRRAMWFVALWAAGVGLLAGVTALARALLGLAG